METQLYIYRMGNYSMGQVERGDNCKICGNMEFGDVLIKEYALENDGICGKCLINHFNNTSNKTLNQTEGLQDSPSSG